jgi:hypothetical protein
MCLFNVSSFIRIYTHVCVYVCMHACMPVRIYQSIYIALYFVINKVTTRKKYLSIDPYIQSSNLLSSLSFALLSFSLHISSFHFIFRRSFKFSAFNYPYSQSFFLFRELSRPVFSSLLIPCFLFPSFHCYSIFFSRTLSFIIIRHRFYSVLCFSPYVLAFPTLPSLFVPCKLHIIYH